MHLHSHQERIVLADASAFDLADDEAQQIVHALNAEFADIGHFHAASATRWYLRLNEAVNHPAAPLSAVAGRRVNGELNGSALPLTRWLNEVQMFLHGHPVNAQREDAGQPAINSLWLWGGGALPSGVEPRFSAVFSDDPLATGLARAAGIPAYGRPAAFPRCSGKLAPIRWSSSTSCCPGQPRKMAKAGATPWSNSIPTGSCH